jgi:hypothetical protein
MSSVPLSKVAQQAARAVASLIEEEIGQALSSDTRRKIAALVQIALHEQADVSADVEPCAEGEGADALFASKEMELI